jgi:hypothetical protein
VIHLFGNFLEIAYLPLLLFLLLLRTCLRLGSMVPLLALQYHPERQFKFNNKIPINETRTAALALDLKLELTVQHLFLLVGLRKHKNRILQRNSLVVICRPYLRETQRLYVQIAAIGLFENFQLVQQHLLLLRIGLVTVGLNLPREQFLFAVQIKRHAFLLANRIYLIDKRPPKSSPIIYYCS